MGGGVSRDCCGFAALRAVGSRSSRCALLPRSALQASRAAVRAIPHSPPRQPPAASASFPLALQVQACAHATDGMAAVLLRGCKAVVWGFGMFSHGRALGLKQGHLLRPVGSYVLTLLWVPVYVHWACSESGTPLHGARSSPGRNKEE